MPLTSSTYSCATLARAVHVDSSADHFLLRLGNALLMFTLGDSSSKLMCRDRKHPSFSMEL
eukprot:5023884-Pyramimonas_sp.AAC.1